MRRPNILLFITDQQRWDTLRLFGNQHIVCPNLDRLAAKSVAFDHCFVQSPLCMPSRVSFMSGRYPSSLGITEMGVPVPEDLVTMPTYFSNAGYRTANLGKLHFLPHANRDHRQLHPSYGFDHVEISDEPGVYEDSYRAWVRWKDPSQLDHLSFGLPPAAYTWYTTMGIPDMVSHPQGNKPREDFGPPVAFPGDHRLTHTAFVADRTTEFLRTVGDQPFLAIASFFAPHAPWVVPQKYLDLYTPEQFQTKEKTLTAQQLWARHGYFAMLSEVDEHVGAVLDELERLGKSEDTIIVFMSDHGEWLGDGGKFGKGYPGDDSVSRIPLLVSLPRQSHGAVCNEFVEAVDILPTLLELAGLQVSPEIQGLSIAPFLMGRPQQFREDVMMEFRGWKSIRNRKHRYIIHNDGHESCYHASDTPTIEIDLEAETKSSLRHRVLTRLLKQEQSLARTWPY
jgi:arylsulfatase A-like enzyme